MNDVNKFFGVVNFPIILGSTHIRDFIYEVRFSDSTKKRVDFKKVSSVYSEDLLPDSGCRDDFGKSFLFKTSAGGSVIISSIFLHDI